MPTALKEFLTAVVCAELAPYKSVEAWIIAER